MVGDPTFDAGRVGRAASFDGDTEVSFGNVGAFDRGDAFSLAVWLKGRGNLPMAVFQKLESADRRRGYEWRLDDIALVGIQKWAARLTVALAVDLPDDAIEIRTRERLTLGDWYHVALTYDGSGKAAGLALYVNGARLDVEVVRDTLSRADCDRRAAARRQQGAREAVHRSDRRPAAVQPRADAAADRGARDPPPDARHSLRRDRQAVEGRGGQDARLFPHLCGAGCAADDVSPNSRRSREQKEELVKLIPTAMVMAEMKKPRDTFILARGDYRNQTDKVQPGVPAMLPPLPKDAPLNRLTLAKWLVDPGHPLTSRVAVNRYLADVFRRRHRQDAGRFRRAGRAAGRIRSCSTGWRPNSCAPVGTSGRCSG